MDAGDMVLDPVERWFFLAPLMMLVFGWLQLNFILLGYGSSLFSVCVLLAISYFASQKLFPAAASENSTSHLVVVTLAVVVFICEILRPATGYPVQYDAAYHILQASTYAELLDFDAFAHRIFRPPLLPVLLSATLAFDEGGTLSLALMKFIVLLFGLQTYVLGKRLGASTTSATVFAAAAISSPIVVDWGARYYHGIFAAMMATLVMNLLLCIDWKKCSTVLIVFIGFSSGGIALARYSFSYLLGLLGFTALMSKRIQPMVWFLLAWALAVLPFMLNDWHETGDFLASLRPQINAPVDRALDPVEGVGWSAQTFSVLGYVDFRGELLTTGTCILALCGFATLIQKKRWSQFAVVSAVVLPHVMIYSLLLGYGEARYMLLVVPLGCALAACGFEPVINWVNQLINPQPQSLTINSGHLPADDSSKFSQGRFNSTAHPALTVMVILLTVVAPFVDHLTETEDYHSSTNEWVEMLRSLAYEVPEDATLVASAKDYQTMWLSKEYSREPPNEFQSLRSWMDGNGASHIITRNRGNPEPCARDVTLCIEAPWLEPVAARSESSGWAILWEYDGSAGEYQPSNVTIEPFVQVNEQWKGHEEGTTDLIRNDLLVVRHYDDLVTLNPGLANATSLQIDIVVFRFDAWPDAAIDLEYGLIENMESDDRFYAASWNGTAFAHSGPFASQNSLPTFVNEPFTFTPSDYGHGGASGVHYVRLRSIDG